MSSESPEEPNTSRQKLWSKLNQTINKMGEETTRKRTEIGGQLAQITHNSSQATQTAPLDPLVRTYYFENIPCFRQPLNFTSDGFCRQK
jgi:hypothetical protein